MVNKKVPEQTVERKFIRDINFSEGEIFFDWDIILL